MLRGTEDFADVIKLRILRWGDSSRLSAWALCNYSSPCKREAGVSVLEEM